MQALRVADETAAFLLRDLRTAEGGFASALDADTDGVEGKTYAWTPAQLEEVLGADDGAWAARLLSVTAEGTFEHGASTLQLLVDPDDPARWVRVRAALLAARDERPQPARDDKVVTAWNGLAIVALAEGGAALARPGWIEAAVAAPPSCCSPATSSTGGCAVRRATAWWAPRRGCWRTTPPWPRACSRCTRPPAPPDGWMRPSSCSTPRWPTSERTASSSTPPTTPRPCCTARARSPTAPRPAGSSALASALLTASVLTEDGGRYRSAAEAALRGAGTVLAPVPAVRRALADRGGGGGRGPLQVAVAGSGPALLAEARRLAPGGTVVVAGEPDAPGVPLLADRPLVGGGAAAYVCRGFVCDCPVTTPAALAAAVRPR